MASKAVWEKIRAAFIAGTGVGELAKRFKVSIADILKRAKDEGWRRGQQQRKATVTTLPVLATAPAQAPPPDPAVKLVQDDIIREHRERTRAQRDLYDKLLIEFQEMLRHLVSFVDPATMMQIQAQQQPEERIKLLSSLLKATAVKFTMFERLNLMLREIVTVERLVWGLDADKNPEDNSAAWEELVAKVRIPAVMPAMPAHILSFEDRLKRVESRRERDRGGGEESNPNA